MAYNLLFPYFRHNFAANYDAMNCTTQSSKHESANLNFLAILSEMMTRFNVTYTTHRPYLIFSVIVKPNFIKHQHHLSKVLN